MTTTLKANKALGQNFLKNDLYIKQIIQAANISNEDIIVEIGPGLGALTKYLITTPAKKIICIEKDKRFVSLLRALPSDRLEIVEGDALELKFTNSPSLIGRGLGGGSLKANNPLPNPPPKRGRELSVNQKVKIVANLPYNISTELLFGWLGELDKIKSLTLMFQKEVAFRICANAGDKNYGKISIITEILCQRHLLFDIPPEAFDPAPKVTSSVIHLIPRDKPLFNIDLNEFGWFLDNIFSQRRKTIKNGVKHLLSNTTQQKNIDAETLLEKANIPLAERAENISTKNFVELYRVWEIS